MAIAQNYPDAKPTLLLDFVNSKSLDPRLTYTRASTATYFDNNGVMKTAFSGEGRLDYDPDTGELLGWLSEPGVTNYLLRSEDFTTTWVSTETTVSSNSSNGLDGTTTADKLVASSNSGNHLVSQTFTSTTATRTFFVFAKQDELQYLALRLFDGTTQQAFAYFDLSDGSVGTVAAGTARIKRMKNGYYKCIVYANSMAASASATAEIYLADADNSNSFTGNDSDGLTVWGAQVENNNRLDTSYIKTEAAQVTRAADNVSLSSANLSSWLNQTEGTFYIEQSYSGVVNGGTFARNRAFLFRLKNTGLNGFNNQITFGGFAATGGTLLRPFVDDVSDTVFKTLSNNIATLNDPVTALDKAAFTYAPAFLSNTSNAANVTQNTNANATRPQWDDCSFTSSYESTLKHGYVKRIAYYSSQLSNDQIQKLTA
jgi:hypothetical protein